MNKYDLACSNLKNYGMIAVREYECGQDEMAIQFNVPSNGKYTYERKGFSSAIAIRNKHVIEYTLRFPTITLDNPIIENKTDLINIMSNSKEKITEYSYKWDSYIDEDSRRSNGYNIHIKVQFEDKYITPAECSRQIIRITKYINAQIY